MTTVNERILIVDDEAPVANLLAQALRQEGYEVGQAVDGMDAMNRIHRQLVWAQFRAGKPRPFAVSPVIPTE